MNKFVDIELIKRLNMKQK